MWRLARWVKIQNYLPKFLPSLLDLKCPNGVLTITREIKTQAFRSHFFPDPEETENLNIESSNYPFPLDLPRIIQADEIREIMRK